MLKRILCPVDFHNNSLEALRLARRLAEENKAKLYMLHVIPLTDPTVVSAPLFAEQEAEIARADLAKIAREELAGVEHETLLRFGHPAKEIVAAERDIDADLVVLATHGRTGISHLILGSVAERVVRESTCPVLTVRMKGAKTLADEALNRPSA